MKVILISGKAQNGKDTAEELCDKLGILLDKLRGVYQFTVEDVCSPAS